MSLLNEYFERLLPIIEDDLRVVLAPPDDTLPPFYHMLHYHMGWVEVDGQPIAGKGGKRLRPMICLLVCEAASGTYTAARPAAAAVELIHNFSLIHDDIQDQSALRRNRPTLWSIWGAAQAINCGDAMFALAHLALPRLAALQGTPLPVEMFTILDETSLELTRGQHLDMSFESRDRVGSEECLAMIASKTAALIAAAAQMGALSAQADSVTQQHYRAFGHNLGMAFQIRDDILDIWGDPTETGKQAANDIRQRKKSLPVTYGLEHSAELGKLYSSQQDFDDAQVTYIVNRLEEVGARRYTEGLARHYTEQTLSHLRLAAPQGEAGQALFELVDQLLHRQG